MQTGLLRRWCTALLVLASVDCTAQSAPKMLQQKINRPPIDDYLRGLVHVPFDVAAAPHLDQKGTPTDLGIIDRRRKICESDTYSQTNDFQEIVALDPNTSTIYPGALVQGASLASGRFTPIALARGPLALTVTGLAVSGPNVQLSADVSQPSLRTVQAALSPIVNDPSHIAPHSIARMALQIGIVRSFDQGLLDAGVSASWLSGDFSSRLRAVTTSKKTSLILKFTQVYYEVSTNDLESPSSVFERRVSLDQIKQVAYNADEGLHRAQNPPLLVRTVKYGRIAIIAISSDSTEDELTTAIRASFDGLIAHGSMNLDAATKSILEHSNYDGLVIGGSAEAGAALLGSVGAGNIDGLVSFLNQGASYNPQNSPGAPISYVLTYLDNQVADSSFSADFALTGCSNNAVPIDKLRIGWHVGDDDKDQEMYPFIMVKDRTGRIVVDSGSAGRAWATIYIQSPFNRTRVPVNAVWADNSNPGPFEVPIQGQWSLDQCDGVTAETGQRSSNGEDPEWHTTVFVDVSVAGNWYNVRPGSNDHSEFKWGDGKPDSSTIGFSCPNLGN